jgi:hypothetical protein
MGCPLDTNIEHLADDISLTGGFQEQRIEICNDGRLRYNFRKTRESLKKKLY